MARWSNQRATRLLGTVVGLGFCVLGAYTILGGRSLPDPGGRLLWYGITAVVVGLVAIAGSWWAEDPGRIWCRHPSRRWR